MYDRQQTCTWVAGTWAGGSFLLAVDSLQRGQTPQHLRVPECIFGAGVVGAGVSFLWKHFDAFESHHWVMEPRWHVTCRGVSGSRVLASSPVSPALPMSGRSCFQRKGSSNPKPAPDLRICPSSLHREKDT